MVKYYRHNRYRQINITHGYGKYALWMLFVGVSARPACVCASASTYRANTRTCQHINGRRLCSLNLVGSTGPRRSYCTKPNIWCSSSVGYKLDISQLEASVYYYRCSIKRAPEYFLPSPSVRREPEHTHNICAYRKNIHMTHTRTLPFF